MITKIKLAICITSLWDMKLERQEWVMPACARNSSSIPKNYLPFTLMIALSKSTLNDASVSLFFFNKTKHGVISSCRP